MPSPRFRLQSFLEIALIFAIFTLQGAWPVPDVNEPYYLGKAIHYWDPNAYPGDFFMQSADTHKVFYFAIGWLSLVMSQTALAWTGRQATWFLLAWAWRRLSVAVIPRPWYAVLTAALFGCLMERCHMAGEWVIGGVEAKGFAYVFVFLGLEALLRNRWNRALWLFGAAAAFHVLVGGWATVAAAVAWLWLAVRQSKTGRFGCPRLPNLLPGILGGFLLALPGLVPSLTLDWGVSRETLRQAHMIYVFERLPHHLVLWGMRWDFIVRMVLLCVVWLLLGRLLRANAVLFRLRAFVAGAVLISCAGAAIHLLLFVDRALAAGLLRYYWFRLTDVMIPLGVSLEVGALIARRFGGTTAEASPEAANAARADRQPGLGAYWLALALVVAAFHLGDLAKARLAPQPPRAYKFSDFVAWKEACDWIVHSGQIPPHATFITPRMCQTFHWDTGRNEVASWKNVPQDASDLVAWWQRTQDLYATGDEKGTVPFLRPDTMQSMVPVKIGAAKIGTVPAWRESLAELGAARLRQLGAKYHADYLIDQVPKPAKEVAPAAVRNSPSRPANASIPRPPGPLLDLPEMYRNRSYVIYRLP